MRDSESKDTVKYERSRIIHFPPSIIKTVVTTPSRVRFAPSPTGLLHVHIALSGSHSGPEFDKLIQLIEEGTALNLGIHSVRDAYSFVGV